MECEFFATMGSVYTCAVARFAYAGDGEWMLAQGAERASAPCAEADLSVWCRPCVHGARLLDEWHRGRV